MAVGPNAIVVAPVQRALGGIIWGNAVAYAAAIGVALVASLPALDPGLKDVVRFVLPAIIGMYIAGRFVRAAFVDRPPSWESAWDRARDLAPRDAAFARITSRVVPIGFVLAAIAVVWPLLGDPDPVVRGNAGGVYLPIIILLAAAAAPYWLDDCHERLARAVDESDRRFRAYWAHPIGFDA